VYCEGTSRFATSSEVQSGLAGLPVPNKEPLVVYLKRAGQSPERFLIRTQAVPPKRLLEHLHLRAEDFERAGRGPQEVAGTIEAALGPAEVPVVWNASSRQILEELGVKRRALSLKGPYCDWLLYAHRRRRGGALPERGWGSLDEALERHQIAWEPPSEPGRGPRRLGQTEAVLGWFHDQALAHCRDFIC
jgi:hypothetical protein